MNSSWTYLQKMKQYFIKQGKKSVMENLFRTYFFNQAQSKKKKVKRIFFKSMVNAEPLVKLRSRRRGRRTLYRVTYLENKDGLRKSLLAFSKDLKENKKTKFLISLEKELELMSSGKSAATAKRNAFHRLALESTPYSWRKKRWKIKKNTSTGKGRRKRSRRVYKRLEDLTLWTKKCAIKLALSRLPKRRI